MFLPTYVSLLEIRDVPDSTAVLNIASSRPTPEFKPVPVRYEGRQASLYEGDSGYTSGNPNLGKPHHRLVFLKPGFQYIRAS